MEETMKDYKYNIVIGLVHSYCKPCRTNSYFKAIITLLYRRIVFGKGHIIHHDYYFPI